MSGAELSSLRLRLNHYFSTRHTTNPECGGPGTILFFRALSANEHQFHIRLFGTTLTARTSHNDELLAGTRSSKILKILERVKKLSALSFYARKTVYFTLKKKVPTPTAYIYTHSNTMHMSISIHMYVHPYNGVFFAKDRFPTALICHSRRRLDLKLS
jgi:hypothetical protein